MRSTRAASGRSASCGPPCRRPPRWSRRRQRLSAVTPASS
jgi:hypothetical protein